jgi:hypothetical protein
VGSHLERSPPGRHRITRPVEHLPAQTDEFVEKVLIPECTRGGRRARNPEYRSVEREIPKARRRGDRAEVRSLYRRLHGLPSQDPQGPDCRRLRYCRYADDALLGFAGPKAEAEQIKQHLTRFLRDDLDAAARLPGVHDNVDGLNTWAQNQDWFGRWMPDTAEPHNVLLGAHPDGPGWEPADGAVEWWSTAGRVPPPCQLRQCALWYGGTGSDRDASAGRETCGFVPTRPLIDTLGLSKGRDFGWSDPDGLAVHDPSVVLGGPGLLVMRRDLASRLRADGMAVFWTVLVGCELQLLDRQQPGDEYRRARHASWTVIGSRKPTPWRGGAARGRRRSATSNGRPGQRTPNASPEAARTFSSACAGRTGTMRAEARREALVGVRNS